MKSLYDEKDRNTAMSVAFSGEIEGAVKPILDKYIEQGYSIRQLVHEAQAAMGFLEADHILKTCAKDSVERRKKRKRGKKL